MKLLMILVLTLLTSCKNDTTKSVPQQTEVVAPLPEGFEAFYDRFHLDSAFQVAHISFPLEGDPAEEGIDLNDFRWHREDWVIHRPLQNLNTYQQDFSSFKDLIIERISDESGRFTMERRWSKLAGEWNLIYYKAMGL